MIKNVELTGFKSFVSQTIDFNKLTVLTGLNSSGKSSVIQSLLMLQKVANKDSTALLSGHGDFDELRNPYEEAIDIKAECSNGFVEIQRNKPIELTKSNFFPEIIYVSANRFGPEVLLPIKTSEKGLGSKGENVLQIIDNYSDSQINSILRHENSEGDTFLFNLRAWLGVISPNVKFTYRLQKISDSSFAQYNEHRATNVGFGLSYTLPIITALLLGSITPSSLVILENPEAHLHPKGQTEIARLISLCVQVGTQVIIETHSDHLFDGIRIFAKKNPGFAEKVNIFWFELNEHNNTIVETAVLDDDGRLDNWPTGLFDQFEINASKLL
jgi:predicted ATPase